MRLRRICWVVRKRVDLGPEKGMEVGRILH